MAESPDERAPYLAPLPTSEWDQAVLDALEVMRPPADSVYAQRKVERKKGGSRSVGAFGVLARHPALAKAYHQFNRHLLYYSTLTDRVRELVVLRVAFHRRCDYEWAQHVPVARSVGVTDDEIGRVVSGPDAPGWSEVDAAVVRAVDELHHNGAIGADTWRVLVTAFDEKQLMDLVFTAGAYDTLALAFNTFGLELDPEIADLSLSRWGVV